MEADAPSVALRAHGQLLRRHLERNYRQWVSKRLKTVPTCSLNSQLQPRARPNVQWAPALHRFVVATACYLHALDVFLCMNAQSVFWRGEACFGSKIEVPKHVIYEVTCFESFFHDPCEGLYTPLHQPDAPATHCSDCDTRSVHDFCRWHASHVCSHVCKTRLGWRGFWSILVVIDAIQSVRMLQTFQTKVVDNFYSLDMC